MNEKRKALSRLRDARGRLRDIEAARTAQAAARCDQEERGLAAAGRDLASAVVAACDKLAGARGVGDLEAAWLDVGTARQAVTEARVQVTAAEELRRAAADRLGQRERELRTTERALEHVAAADRREGDRREQRMVDDLVGGRELRREP
jgi:hypothetical protein